MNGSLQRQAQEINRLSSVNEDVTLRRDQQANLQRELRDRQSMNMGSSFDTRPPLRSALRNSRYQ